MNLVALIGNVWNEPELTYTPEDKAVCRFRLAVSRPGGEDADFFDIVALDRQATICGEYLQMGRRVGIEGSLRQGQGGVSVIANRVQLLSSPKKVEETV